MRNTFLRSPSLTRADDPSLRFRFVSFEVKMWRRCERPRFTLPVAVFLKRLAAPLCVFSFGIIPQTQLSALGRQLSKALPVVGFDSRLAYDAGLATCAAGWLGLGALCAAAFCLSFSLSFSDFLGARIA